MLNEDLIGAAILQKSKTKELTNQDRDRLSDMIITNFLNKFKKMDHEHFKMLSQKIIQLMPKEKQATYFVEPIKKKDSHVNRSERARGKLVEKYRNRLHLLKTISEENMENKDHDNSTETQGIIFKL